MLTSRLACVLLIVMSLAALPACSRAPQRGKPDLTFTTRGKVVMLPDKAKPTSEFQVHHEAIDDFDMGTGKKGMDSMIMPFPLAKNVSLEGLAVGDIIELTFVVWTTPGIRGYEVTALKELPPETTLEFRKANPTPTAATPATPAPKPQP